MPISDLKDFKRTKIIATLGPSINSYEDIKAIIEAGANGLRLNFGHGTYDEKEKSIEWIRKASHVLNKPVAIIQDLQGPKIRLGDFDDIINVQKGQILSFKYQAEYPRDELLPVQYDFSGLVKRGERLYLYDGKISTTIISVRDGIVRSEAQNDGILIKRKGINLPDTDLMGEIITDKDKADIVFGAEHDIDFVALSFVQTHKDIIKLKRLLKSHNSQAKVIAKIETKSAVENVEDIIKEADAIMIARGDLAVETTPESVPVEQRRIIGLCQRYAKPTIVATQLLGSMTDHLHPSRSEVSDVATAVVLGADSVMLSEETASGSYPLEAVEAMKKIIKYSEQHMPLKIRYLDNSLTNAQMTISKAIIDLASDLNAAAIVAETKSGATALQISSYRGQKTIFAVSSDQRTAQRLAIVFGVKTYVRPVSAQAAQKLTDWLRTNKLFRKGDIILLISGRHPGVVGTTDTIKVRLME